MKRTMYLFACLILGSSLLVSCVTNVVKKPKLIDHKNQKWSKPAPDWVSKEASELEKKSQYSDVYLFKFESPRGKSLEGVELWTRDFSVPSEMARMIKMRVESKASVAAAGDKNLITGYLEDIVNTFTNTRLSGLKKEADYWIQQRYFDEKGKPLSDDYTYLVLYSISKSTLDRLVRDAINGADEVKPKTEEEKRVRELVRNSLKNGI